MKTTNYIQLADVVTHSGVFHADEIFGIAALCLLNEDIFIARVSELPADFEPLVGQTVLDIGGKYSPNQNLFDHHQRGDKPPVRENGVPRSAFGALWQARGKLISAAVLRAANKPQSDVADAVDKALVEGIDAIDCGWTPDLGGTPTQDGFAWASNSTWAPSGEGQPLPLNPPGQPASVSALISGFNPVWDAAEEGRVLAFFEAVKFAVGVLRRAILSAGAEARAEARVMEAEVVGETLVLEQYVPWQDPLFQREDELSLLYVVYPSLRGGWMLQQVPVIPGSFEGRKPLPQTWRGLRGEDLAEMAGVADATFCHPAAFCGGAETKKGALALAAKAAAS